MLELHTIQIQILSSGGVLTKNYTETILYTLTYVGRRSNDVKLKAYHAQLHINKVHACLCTLEYFHFTILPYIYYSHTQ